jgi:hypothetical protein
MQQQQQQQQECKHNLLEMNLCFVDMKTTSWQQLH